MRSKDKCDRQTETPHDLSIWGQIRRQCLLGYLIVGLEERSDEERIDEFSDRSSGHVGAGDEAMRIGVPAITPENGSSWTELYCAGGVVFLLPLLFLDLAPVDQSTGS